MIWFWGQLRSRLLQSSCDLTEVESYVDWHEIAISVKQSHLFEYLGFSAAAEFGEMANECILHHELGTLVILFRDLISELEQSSKSCPPKLLTLASTAVFYCGVRI